MRFSRRASWALSPNALSSLLEEKRARGEALFDLTLSNPTRAGFSYDEAAILAALASPAVLTYEPTPEGLPAGREAVAAYYRERGVPVDPARVLLTASTSEAYAYCFKLLCDPGERILVPAPSYPLFEFLASLEGVGVDTYPLAYHDGWSLEAGALEAAVSPRTRALVVVSPNNPTGSVLSQVELAALRALCLRHGLALIADEVFGDYPLSDAVAADPALVRSVAAEREVLTFTLSGLSKVVGLPQLKLGWMGVSGPGASEAYERLLVIADTYLSVGAPVQHAAAALLREGAALAAQVRGRTRENLASLQRRVAGTQCTLLRAQAGWSATLRIPRLHSEEDTVLSLLRERNVLVFPGHFFDFSSEAFVVLSLLAPPAVFEEGTSRLFAHLQALAAEPA